MTMEIEVKNVSEGYIAEVREVERHEGDNPDVVVERHALRPGESVRLFAWDTRDIIIKEKGEVQLEKAGKEDIPEEDSETNILWRDHSIKPEMCEGGWCLADYSGDVIPAGYCGISMLFSDVINVSDPFPTKDDAVTAGLLIKKDEPA